VMHTHVPECFEHNISLCSRIAAKHDTHHPPRATCPDIVSWEIRVSSLGLPMHTLYVQVVCVCLMHSICGAYLKVHFPKN
jgi:hypothetical protein